MLERGCERERQAQHTKPQPWPPVLRSLEQAIGGALTRKNKMDDNQPVAILLRIPGQHEVAEQAGDCPRKDRRIGGSSLQGNLQKRLSAQAS